MKITGRLLFSMLLILPCFFYDISGGAMEKIPNGQTDLLDVAIIAIDNSSTKWVPVKTTSARILYLDKSSDNFNILQKKLMDAASNRNQISMVIKMIEDEGHRGSYRITDIYKEPVKITSSVQAEKLGSDLLQQSDPKLDLSIFRIVEKKFGWVFYYNSKEFAKTGDRKYELVGLGPLIVDRSGNHKFLPSASNTFLENLIDDYETDWEKRVYIK